MSSSYSSELSSLQHRLASVSLERNHLLQQLQEESNDAPLAMAAITEKLYHQRMQRYEERIVELQSVIGELSRQLREQPEEEEDDEQGDFCPNLDVIDEEEDDNEEDNEEDDYESFDDHDYTSLAFERDVEASHSSLLNSKLEEAEIKCVRLENELESSQKLIQLQNSQLEQYKADFQILSTEKARVSRQLADLKASLEAQEAKARGRPRRPSSAGRLRRNRNNNVSPDSSEVSYEKSNLAPEIVISDLKAELEATKQNLAENRSRVQELSEISRRHEENEQILQRQINLDDQIIESYDNLLAIVEHNNVDNNRQGWTADDSSSSGCYSHTASSTSTTSSTCAPITSTEPLRRHISSLRAKRSSLSSSFVNVDRLESSKSSLHRLRRELASSQENSADLRAQLYILECEKSDFKLALEEARTREQVLRVHVQHLRRKDDSETRGKVEALLEALEQTTVNNEARQTQNEQLIQQLKAANATLTKALKTKLKQNKGLKQRAKNKCTSSTTTNITTTSATSPLGPRSSIPVPVSRNLGRFE